MVRIGLVLWLGVALPLQPLRAQQASVLPRPSRAWHAPQRVLGGAFVTVLVVDVAQTHLALGRGHREANPLLGAAPSRTLVTVLAAGTGLAVLGTAHRLRRPWRTLLLSAAVLLETIVILRNGAALRHPTQVK